MVIKFLIHIIFIVFNLLYFSFLTASGINEKPNSVNILVDDLGYADLGMHGSKQVPTPHIDQLGKVGVIFSSGYVSSPVCSHNLKIHYFPRSGS